MALATTLNIVLAAFVLVAIVGGMAWSIVRDRQARMATAGRVRARAATAARLRQERRRGRQAYAAF